MSILYKMHDKRPVPYHGEVNRTNCITVRYETLSHASMEVTASKDVILFTVRVLGRRVVFVAHDAIEALDVMAYLKTVGFTF